MRNNIISQLRWVFPWELYEILHHYIEQKYWNFHRYEIYNIIEIWKKIDQNFKEDFVLHLEYYNDEKLKIFNEIISLLKFYKINILSFQEYYSLNLDKQSLDFLQWFITNDVLESVKNIPEFKEKIFDFLQWWSQESFQSYMTNITKKTATREYNFTNKWDEKLVWVYLYGNDEEKEKIVKKIKFFLSNLSDRIHPSQTTSTCNSQFWKWSWSYSEVIWNYIIKKLYQWTNESNNEYLERILSLTLTWVFNVQNMSDVNRNHELRCLYNACETMNEEKMFFSFLEDIEVLMGKISWESALDLGELQKYYNNIFKEELKKIKKTLELSIME